MKWNEIPLEMNMLKADGQGTVHMNYCSSQIMSLKCKKTNKQELLNVIKYPMECVHSHFTHEGGYASLFSNISL